MSVVHISSRHLVKGLFFMVATMLYAHNAEGLRGCSSFGHSCFGAHGKRTDNRDGLLPSARPEVLDDGQYPLDSNYDFNFPHSRPFGDFDGKLAPGRGKVVPLALLKMLRNMMSDMQEEEPSPGRQ